MSDKFTFASPGWLYLALLIVPLVVVKVAASYSARQGVERLTSQRLRPHLIYGSRPMGDWGRFVLQALGLVLIAVALARPQKGFTEELTRVEGRNLIIAIDTSRSMLAEDISPQSRTSRLTQAKLAAEDLVRQLPDDRIGLIAFSGSAFVQAPLTPDHAAVIETIEQLDTYAIERGGTSLAAPIKLARERFAKAEAARSALVIFTDGEDHEGKAMREAEIAEADGITIVTIGVGQTVPSIIPNPEARGSNEFLTEANGDLIKSAMDAESLEKLADATSGIFINLKGGLMNSQLVDKVLSNISYSESDEKMKRTPREHFAIPLAAGLVCLVGGYLSTLWGSRPAPRSAIAALVLFLGLLSGQPLHAAAAQDAFKAFSESEFDTAKLRYTEAAKNADDPELKCEMLLGAGTCWYIEMNYTEAIDSFAGALLSKRRGLQTRAHYNLGNSLFRNGEQNWEFELADKMKVIDDVIRDWEDAASHYRSTLEIEADHADAIENLRIVEELLEKLKKYRDEQREKENEEDSEEPEDPEEDPEPEEGEDEEDPEKDESEEEGEESDQEGESEGDPEGEPEGEPQPGDGETEGAEKSETGEKAGEETEVEDASVEDPDGEEGGGGKADGEGDENTFEEDEDGDDQLLEADQPDPDDEVDKETGYSKNQARKSLRELSDEQRDLDLLRRRRVGSSSRKFKDW